MVYRPFVDMAELTKLSLQLPVLLLAYINSDLKRGQKKTLHCCCVCCEGALFMLNGAAKHNNIPNQ